MHTRAVWAVQGLQGGPGGMQARLLAVADTREPHNCAIFSRYATMHLLQNGRKLFLKGYSYLYAPVFSQEKSGGIAKKNFTKEINI